MPVPAFGKYFCSKFSLQHHQNRILSRNNQIGFSVGDFVTCAILVKDLIKALQDTTGSSAEYQGLIKELFNLERALTEVKHLNLHES